MSTKIESLSQPQVRSTASRGSGSVASTARGSATAGTSSSKPVAAIERNDEVSLTGGAMTLQEFQRAATGAPSTDRSRIERIKQSIADGSYTIDPKKIAARLARLDWELGTQ